MSPTLMARVDGAPRPAARTLSGCGRRQTGRTGGPSGAVGPEGGARIERQTAGVHDCQLPVWARQLVAEEVAELERQEIRGALLEAGIL